MAHSSSIELSRYFDWFRFYASLILFTNPQRPLTFPSQISLYVLLNFFPHLYSVFYTGPKLSVRTNMFTTFFLTRLETHDQEVVVMRQSCFFP